MKGISKEEKILFLQLMMNRELKKPIHEMDADKVSRYVDELLTLQGKNYTLTPEEIEERVSQIPFK